MVAGRSYILPLSEKGQQSKCCDFYAILKLTEDELSFVKYEFERKFES